MSRLLVAIGMSAAIALLTACSSSAPATVTYTVTAEPAPPAPAPSEPAPTVVPPEPTEPPAPAPEPIEAVPEVPAFVDPSESVQSGDAQLLIDAIDLDRATDADRIEIVLSGVGTPGWSARYVDQLYEDGSGFEVELGAPVNFELYLTGMALPEKVFPGYGEPSGELAVLQVVELISENFEGRALIGIGLSEQVPYRMWLDSNPTRVVVEFVSAYG